LLKFGFEHDHAGYFIKCGSFELIWTFDEGQSVRVDMDTTNCRVQTSAKVKYVHSLQNLYFALKGEELPIK